MTSDGFSLEGFRVLIGTPAYEGKIHFDYVASLFRTERVVREAGGVLDFFVASNRASHVAMRNNILDAAIEYEASHLVFIDGDVGWDAEDFVRLISSPYDVVGVLPQVNFPVGGFPYAFKPLNDEHTLSVDDDGFCEVAGLPAAFLMLTRDCLLRLRAAYPGLKYRENDKERFALFDSGLKPMVVGDELSFGDLWWSEDYLFCDRWRDIGGKVMLYARAGIRHWKVLPLATPFEEYLRREWKIKETVSP